MILLIGLAIGALLAWALQPTIPAEAGRYVAMVLVAGIDASFGGLRSWLEGTFSDRAFVVSFLTNATGAVALVWLGDQLDVDLVTAVAVVLGIRIFQNLAAIRRRMLGG